MKTSKPNDLEDIPGDANHVRRMILSAVPVSESRLGLYRPTQDAHRAQQLEDLIQAMANLFWRRKQEHGEAVGISMFLENLSLRRLQGLVDSTKIEAPGWTEETTRLQAYIDQVMSEGARKDEEPELLQGYLAMLLVRALTSMRDEYTPCPWGSTRQTATQT